MESKQSTAHPGGGRGHVWRFADCEYDELRRELRVRGTVVDIEVKPLDILHQLLLHAGEVVTKDELLESVWPGLTVVDGSLATAVSKLRKVLGSDDTIVVTVPRIGYRLGAPVQSMPVAPPPWPERRLEPGQPVPRRDQWRLVRRLDLSPSSDVWLAEHPKTGQARVFKFAPDAERLKGLKREVTLARLLRQSLGERADFVRILEWNFDSDPHFIESEYCGPNLAEWAEARGGPGRVPLDLRLRLFLDVTRAVAAAHSLDVLHKDLKPGNILVSEGSDGGPQIKIADFGSASLSAPARLAALGITNLGFTQSGDSCALSGTVMYVAPELLAGQSPSPRSDVYSLGVLLYQLVVGDFRKPLAPGWEADVADPLLREDIAQAACGDPDRRFATAADLETRLRNLESRRRDAAAADEARQRALAAQGRRAAARARLPWLAVAAVAFLAAVAMRASMNRGSSVTPRVSTLAVLPFQNVGSDQSLDFLRLALPDEIATTLSHARGIGVRPFAATSRYGDPDLDLRKAARDLGADGIVAGRFLKIANQLHITIEAIDPEHNRSVWRDTIDVPAQSLIAAQIQIALRVRGGLAPAFGGSTSDSVAPPKNEEAYELFLRGASLPVEAAANPEAISSLEKAVALDSSYAPAWFSLGRRYYVDARYGHGTPADMDRMVAASERAVSLDPGYIPAVAGLVAVQVERGDLVSAYRRAADLVRRRPDSVDAQFTLSYVLRYAGLLHEAAEHCDAALLLDPHTVTSGLRSCAIVFNLRGEAARAMNYVQIAPGSGWTKAFTLDARARDGQVKEARDIGSPSIPQWPSFDLLAACIADKPAAEIVAIAQTIRPSDDPEQNYVAAAHLAYCGQTGAALQLLKQAIAGNYCSTAAVESDPLFARLRAAPEFAEIRTAAIACRDRFRAAAF